MKDSDEARKDASVLALVTARGSSKGLPGKNIRPMCGRPMIAWTVEAARRASCVDRVVVSSDDPAILAAAEAAGAEAPFIRPAALAADHVSGVDPVLHALDWLESRESYRPPWVLLLQPTSPLRTSEDIDEAFRLAQRENAGAVMGVTMARSHPYWTKKIDDKGRLHDFLPAEGRVPTRQGLPAVYVVNGAIYLVKTDCFVDAKSFSPEPPMAYVMPAERSVDVDDLFDFQLAEWLMSRREEKHQT